MVNQKLIIQDPFIGTGNFVCGERFVGRQDLVKRLRRNCARQNYSIQGLPHTGKTSLVKHSIMYDAKLLDSILPLCTVYISIDACETKIDFYKELVFSTYKAVKEKLSDSNDLSNLEVVYKEIVDSGFDRIPICSMFEQTIKEMKVCLIIIYDRFDYVKKLAFKRNDFSNLSTFVSPENVKCIVISIGSVSDIEKDLQAKDAGSVFSQLFLSTTIVLEQYSEEDIKVYWERLVPYYNSIGLPLDDDYKKKAIYYAGSNPFLLDTYNNLVSQEYQNTKKQPCPEDLRIMMRRIYMSHISSLERNNLLDMAIQVILGPVYDIDKDKMDLLKQYDFLREISEKDKRALIGHEMGYVDEYESLNGNKETKAYAASSDYFTLLFKRDYARKADFWKEWSATFRSLQLLCRDFLEAKWGDQWPEKVEEEAIRQMLSDKKIDENANITASPLIEYLRESSIGNLIDKYWKSFELVFSPIGQHTFKQHYTIVKNLRNHHAHNNTRFLSEKDKELANKYLDEIGKKVNAWLQSGKKFDLGENLTSMTTSPIHGEKDVVHGSVSPQAHQPTIVEETKPSCKIAFEKQSRPKVNLESGESLGKLFLSKNSISLDNCTWINIDRISGYRPGYSPRIYSYKESSWVVFRLKDCIKSNGRPSKCAIDIHPA